ncbi:MAG: oligosaccharide flippase family protein, partial [Balneolaceae bacterium]
MGNLASKASWILSGDVGVRVVGFLTTVYLARTFGADGYGIIIIGLSVLGVALWFTDLGLNTLGTREISKIPQHTYSADQIFSAKLVMSVVS